MNTDKRRQRQVTFSFSSHTPAVNCCLVGCCSRGARRGKPFEGQQRPVAGPSPAWRKRLRTTIAWTRPNAKEVTATSEAPSVLTSVGYTPSSFAGGAKGKEETEGSSHHQH